MGHGQGLLRYHHAAFLWEGMQPGRQPVLLVGDETSTRPKSPEQVGEESGDHVGWKEDKHDVGVIQTDATRIAGDHGDLVGDPGVSHPLSGSRREHRVSFEPDCNTTAPRRGLE